jgi:hypothetical protein
MPDVLPSPTPSASPPSVRAVRELLAALRRPIDELCSRGLPNLAHPDGEERVLELAAQMADAAGALAAAFAGKSARTASEAEVLRRKKTAEDLAQLATSAKNLGRSPLGERQRVVALGLRLCAGVSMYLPQSTEKRSVSAVAPTPIAKPAPESKPAPKPESRPESDADDPLVQPLLGLPGVGPVTAEKLAVKGLTRVIDALYFLPKRYDDLRQVVPVGQLQPGVLQATVVLVERTKVVWARKRFLEAISRRRRL